jgi:hypothetical protein
MQTATCNPQFGPYTESYNKILLVRSQVTIQGAEFFSPHFFQADRVNGTTTMFIRLLLLSCARDPPMENRDELIVIQNYEKQIYLQIDYKTIRYVILLIIDKLSLTVALQTRIA